MMKNRDKILDVLMNTNDYISGEKLSQFIGISRTAIWKNINRLKEEGYHIDSVTNKGYRLIEEPSTLSESQLMHDLKTLGFTHVQLDDTVDSTNLEAKRRADQVEGHGCFVAREQTSGRGRRGRYWSSPKDSGCYVSILLRPDIMPSDAAMITLIAGLSLAKTLNQLYKLDAKIKWPNDIIIQGKKVAGILTEMSAEIDYVNYLVVGIGLNVSQQAFSSELNSIATSLEMASNQGTIEFNRHKYIQTLITEFMHYIETFFQIRDLSFMKKEYENLCLNIKGDVRVVGNKDSYIGVGQGITNQGELLVLTPAGDTMKVHSGEVSVRGIYGYV
jgi:BirA family biotin operon repressor/biotin-[acetyl-CoA-carboxylase] ligase